VAALLSILPGFGRKSGGSKTGGSKNSVGGLTVFGACLHNLKDVDFSIEPYRLTALVGVSGAGKSTLLFDAVEQSLVHGKAVGCSKIEGVNNFSSVVSSRHMSRVSPLSTTLSWLGLDENVRRLYASIKDAKEKKFPAGRFSFNGKAGQCSLCKGAGVEKISMDFLGNIEAPCSKCNGLRFEPETLTITYRERNIGEFLQMSCSQAIEFLSDSYKVDADDLIRGLKLIEEAGLGYIEPGRSLSTFSGGELQRLELVRALSTGKKGCLYLFDEPTRGLHPLDVLKLVNLLRKISNEGNTVCVVEHNEQFISACDKVVELGPVGGPKGGFIVSAEDK
jgi:excinuclease ABC subunit A